MSALTILLYQEFNYEAHTEDEALQAALEIWERQPVSTNFIICVLRAAHAQLLKI